MRTELGWHFAQDNMRTRYTDEPITVGEWLECEGEIELCANGMHASKNIMDALGYAPGSMICRVEVEGEILEGDDKIAGRRRRVIYAIDGKRLLHEFACRCAEDALALIPNPDPRSVAAIKAKRDWLAGKITDSDLRAVRGGALDAAHAAHTTYADGAYAVADAARAAAHTAAATAADDADAARRTQARRLVSMVISQAKSDGVYQ